MRFLLVMLMLSPPFAAKAQAIPDNIYNQSLEYMLENPPRAYGHRADVGSENKRLAEENRRLYEGMNRLELVMNYIAATCSAIHPVHDAICDGRAMLRLIQIQQERAAFTGS